MVYSYTATEHPVPHRVKSSFVIFDIWHSDTQPSGSECPDIKNCKWLVNPVWHRMLCSCTYMATVGTKELTSHKILCSAPNVSVLSFGVGLCFVGDEFSAASSAVQVLKLVKVCRMTSTWCWRPITITSSLYHSHNRSISIWWRSEQKFGA